MKKNMVLTTLMAFVAIAIFAQGQDNRPAPGGGQRGDKMSVDERAKHQTDKLSEVVQLTPDQYTKALAINKDFAAQRAALKGAGAPGEMSDADREKGKALNKDRDDKIKALLTADQIKKWEANRKEQRGKGQGGGGMHHGE